MSSLNIDASELGSVGRDLKRSGVRIGAKVSLALRAGAFRMERSAKAAAPVDTGALKSSISTTFEGDGRFGSMSAVIGPTVDYGIWQELGTSAQPPQPYLGPAFDQNIGAVQQAIGQAAQDGVLP